MATLDIEDTSEEVRGLENNVASVSDEKKLIEALQKSIAEHQERLRSSLPKTAPAECHD